MHILVTGGAGFIGSNLAARAIALGADITIVDNLTRSGSAMNLEWLRSLGSCRVVNADIRDPVAVREVMRASTIDAVFHEAAQVAVTTSVEDPRRDFEINALGTLNLLEALRLERQNPVVIIASTNKVYGALTSLRVVERDGRYAFPDAPEGVSEDTPLEFYSPYGCSKGSADQYALDYRRIYGLRTIVFRQSCIYGRRQMGMEDQGWLAWFAMCALDCVPITIYGDGHQVRDVLYIDDLVDAYFHAIKAEPKLTRFVFNVGGGVDRAVSLLDVLRLLEVEIGRPCEVEFSDWRPGDQRVYVSDIRRACGALAWAPKTDVRSGLSALVGWIRELREQGVALVSQQSEFTSDLAESR